MVLKSWSSNLLDVTQRFQRFILQKNSKKTLLLLCGYIFEKKKKKCEYVYRCIGPFTGQIKSKQQRHLVRGTNKNNSIENK